MVILIQLMAIEKSFRQQLVSWYELLFYLPWNLFYNIELIDLTHIANILGSLVKALPRRILKLRINRFVLFRCCFGELWIYRNDITIWNNCTSGWSMCFNNPTLARIDSSFSFYLFTGVEQSPCRLFRIILSNVKFPKKCISSKNSEASTESN